MMLAGVPNFAFAFGYTNSSWTLKVGLLCEHFCRLLSHMDTRGYHIARAEVDDHGIETRPMLDFAAGYVQRALDRIPKQGSGEPWRVSMNYYYDVEQLREGSVDNPNLHFSPRGRLLPKIDRVAPHLAEFQQCQQRPHRIEQRAAVGPSTSRR